MKLYMWRSRALADYADGYIIAMAPTAGNARDKVLAKVEGSWDANGIASDITSDPTIIRSDVLLIHGSA